MKLSKKIAAIIEFQIGSVIVKRSCRYVGTSVCFLVACVALTDVARADVGSVVVSEVTRDSVTLDWSDPKGMHRLASDVPTYQICWQRADSAASILDECDFVSGDAAKPLRLDGLEPGTLYRIRVMAYAEKSDAFGEWMNDKMRHVATVIQRTAPAAGSGEDEEPVHLLRVASAGKTSLEVELIRSEPTAYAVVRLVYHRRWLGPEEVAALKNPVVPEEFTGPDSSRGWVDVYASDDPRVELPGLSARTAYEVSAYGFDLSGSEGTLLASAGAHTSGNGDIRTVERALAVDHVDVIDRYTRRISSSYGSPVIELLGFGYSSVHVDELDAIHDVAAQLSSSSLALEYLIFEQPEVFAEWQQTVVPTLADFAGAQLVEDLESELEPDGTLFTRGDTNGDGDRNISDGINVLNVLFAGRGELACLDAADANDDGSVDIADTIRLLSSLFGGAEHPAPPYRACGVDPTDDELDCEAYTGCRAVSPSV